MVSDIVDIDHIMLSVENSDRAMSAFSRLGFTMTPPGQLDGMSNRLICFAGKSGIAPNFIELMSLDDAEKAPPAMAEALKIPERAVLMVAATNSAQNTKRALDDAMVEVSPVIDSGRDWRLPSGEILDLTFSIVLPTPGQAPFNWIACQHKTPHHYLRPEFTSHPNGAIALKNIVAVASDPAQAAKHYRDNWQAEVMGIEPVVVRAGDVELHVYEHRTFASFFGGFAPNRSEDHLVGFTVSVADLVMVGEQLREAGLSPTHRGNRIILDPSDACGNLVIFEKRI